MGWWEQIANFPTDTKTLLALLVTNLVATGFLALKVPLDIFKDRRVYQSKVRVDKEIEHLQAQISILYGPLSALLRKHAAIINGIRTPQGIDEQRRKIVFDEIIIPNNHRMSDLIENNYHLIVGPTIPKCFVDFLVHSAWLSTASRVGQIGLSDRFGFPKEFADHVHDTAKYIKAKLDTLTGVELNRIDQ
jgi:hypothetical protein